MERHTTGPETPRLLHRALQEEDAGAFFALNSHPDVLQHTGEPPLRSPDEARAMIAAYPDFNTVGFGRWGCVLRSTGEVIGFCGLKHLPELDAVDVGYRFLPEYWGRGLATEACSACIVFGFETLGLDEIIGLVLPANTASIRVLEKVGMRLDGRETCEGLNALRYVIRRGDKVM
jgi:ribosomal-protein-alanine N-acetyltransferase